MMIKFDQMSSNHAPTASNQVLVAPLGLRRNLEAVGDESSRLM